MDFLKVLVLLKIANMLGASDAWFIIMAILALLTALVDRAEKNRRDYKNDD